MFDTIQQHLIKSKLFIFYVRLCQAYFCMCLLPPIYHLGTLDSVHWSCCSLLVATCLIEALMAKISFLRCLLIQCSMQSKIMPSSSHYSPLLITTVFLFPFAVDVRQVRRLKGIGKFHRVLLTKELSLKGQVQTCSCLTFTGIFRKKPAKGMEIQHSTLQKNVLVTLGHNQAV